MTRPSSFRIGSTVGSRSVFSSVHYKDRPCSFVHPYCLLAASGIVVILTGLLQLCLYFSLRTLTTSLHYTEGPIPTYVNAITLVFTGSLVILVARHPEKYLLMLTIGGCVVCILLCLTAAIVTGMHVLPLFSTFHTCNFSRDASNQGHCTCLSHTQEGFISFVGAPNCHVIEMNLQNVVITMCVLYAFVCTVLVFSFSVGCFWLGVQQQNGSMSPISAQHDDTSRLEQQESDDASSQTDRPVRVLGVRPLRRHVSLDSSGGRNLTRPISRTSSLSGVDLLSQQLQQPTRHTQHRRARPRAPARPRRVASMDHRLPPVHRHVMRAHSLQTQGPHRDQGLPPMGRLQSGQSGSLGSLTAAFPLGWHYGRRLSYVATGQSAYLSTDPSSPRASGGSQLSLNMSDQPSAPPVRQQFSFDPPPPYSLAPPYVDQPPKYCSDEALGTSSNPLTQEQESEMDRPHTPQARDDSESDDQVQDSEQETHTPEASPAPDGAIGVPASTEEDYRTELTSTSEDTSESESVLRTHDENSELQDPQPQSWGSRDSLSVLFQHPTVRRKSDVPTSIV
ncbi:PREDICTED: uncharacterized protein LOC109473698 [Branchiostoma belcheri]|uniref:Uncharacterized protein LOC109473698 n=1 Tax=Branchiostoma belcheri TaxID=7741 RepID=A0A6P4YY77_BRABE|nr:PREDICTED: uncharacterized protein LOC109473698 [Branchiostoma belcheri]